VLVIGAGGLGAPVLLYLVAAGVGTIGLIDDDTVALSNLQRQVIHSTSEVGRRKVDSATGAILRLNPHIVVEPHASRLAAHNALGLIEAYDVAVTEHNFAPRIQVGCLFFSQEAPGQRCGRHF
jgi:adenylyltransferase/sulfurtransferase